MSAGLDGFRSTESRARDGTIETEQRILVPAPVVPFSEQGGRDLGRRYWLEVTRVSKGLVRARAGVSGVELRLFGAAPPLLRLGPSEVVLESDRVRCRYPILGGLLSRGPGGELVVAQIGGPRPELCVAVSGFFARRGALYRQLQRRIHVAVSRGYFCRLLSRCPR